MTTLQKYALLFGLFFFLLLVYLLKPILTPFLVGLLIAYLGDPLVDFLERKGLGRSGAVALVFLIFMLLISGGLLIFIPMLVREVVEIIRRMPEFIAWLQGYLEPFLIDTVGINPFQVDLELLRQSLFENWRGTSGVVSQVILDISKSGLSLAVALANIALVPVVAFYLLRDWDLLIGKIRGLLPRRWLTRVDQLGGECDEVLGAFLRGQLLIMFLLGSIYAFGLWLVGLDIALTIGMMAGFASLVPYLGFIVGLAAATAAALFQFHELMPLAYVLVVFLIGQVLEGMVLTPWLMGDRIGLHPVAIIFAILAGGQLFGFTGVLLALPIAAVIMVFLRHINDLYKASGLYEEPVEEDK